MSEARCLGKSELFESTHLFDHNQAVKLCLGCDFIGECAKRLEHAVANQLGGRGSGPDGTWAGHLVINGRIVTGINRRGRATFGGSERPAPTCGICGKPRAERNRYCSEACGEVAHRESKRRHQKRRPSRVGEKAKKREDVA